MTAQILALSKIEFRNGMWLVLIRSGAQPLWMVMGEHLTLAEAEADLRLWR